MFTAISSTCQGFHFALSTSCRPLKRLMAISIA